MIRGSRFTATGPKSQNALKWTAVDAKHKATLPKPMVSGRLGTSPHYTPRMASSGAVVKTFPLLHFEQVSQHEDDSSLITFFDKSV